MGKYLRSLLNKNVLAIFTGLLLLCVFLYVWIQYVRWPTKEFKALKRRKQDGKSFKNEDMVIKPEMDQLDPRLHALIRRDHVIRPLQRRLPYFLSSPTKDPSMGQGQSIRKLFRNQTNGFFIECGALDGETRSNTLGLERDLQWTGILIEGDPNSISTILSKGRKSYVVPHCLATKKETMKVSYGSYYNLGRIVDVKPGRKEQKLVDVMCLPLFAILKALEVPQVDYFSLDVEGNELDVLKTIPWDEVNILNPIIFNGRNWIPRQRQLKKASQFRGTASYGPEMKNGLLSYT
eukprot:TCALIF_03487-PA protein Name:"Similar to S Protein Star (Drosophila melanogaster)" AED:0.09 eAED:0.09 QI:57/0.66/0.5/0.75/0.33/0.5/4/0/291